MTITFGCGCSVTVDDTKLPEHPVCATHNDRRITRVIVRPPVFCGSCTGPCVQESK